MTIIWKSEPKSLSVSDEFDRLLPEMTEIVWNDLNAPTLTFEGTGEALRTILTKSVDLRDINERAEEWARENAGALVKHLTEEQRAKVNRITVRALQNGYSDDDMAEMILKTVGLTPQWAEAVENYRTGLFKQGFPSADARRKATQYADQLRQTRARQIASTELQAALNMGQMLVWKEWAEDGELPLGTLRRYVVHKDERLCPTCRPLSGKTIPLDGDWKINKQAFLTPPLHPSCRCSEILVHPTGGVVKIAKHGDKGKPGYYLLHPNNAPKGYTPTAADKKAAKQVQAKQVLAAQKKKTGAKKPKKMPPHSAPPKISAKVPASKKGGQKLPKLDLKQPIFVRPKSGGEGQLFGGFEVKKPGPTKHFGGEDFQLPPGGDGDAYEALDAQTKLVVKKYAQGKFGKLGFFGPDVFQDLIDNYYKAIGGKDAPDNYTPPTPLNFADSEMFVEYPSDVGILAFAAKVNKGHKNVALEISEEEMTWGEMKGKMLFKLTAYGDPKTANDLVGVKHDDLPLKYQNYIMDDDVYDGLSEADKGLALQVSEGNLDSSDAYQAADDPESLQVAMGWDDNDIKLSGDEDEDDEDEDEEPDYDEYEESYEEDEGEAEIPAYRYSPSYRNKPRSSDEAVDLPQPKWKPIKSRDLDDQDLSTQGIEPGERLSGFNSRVRDANEGAAKHLDLLSYDQEELEEPSEGAQVNAKRAINQKITERLMGRLEDDEQLQEWTRYNIDRYIHYQAEHVYDRETQEYKWEFFKYEEPYRNDFDYDYWKASGKNPDEASDEEKLLSIYANHAVKGWAETSGDSTSAAIAMQRVAQEHFGLPSTDVDMEHMKSGHTPAAWNQSDEIIEKHQPFMEAFLDSVYDETQSSLANQGIEEVELYRGMRVSDPDSELAPKDTNSLSRDEREELQEKHTNLQMKINALYQKYSSGDMSYEEYKDAALPFQVEQREVMEKLSPKYEAHRKSRVRMQPLSSFSASSSTASGFGETVLSVKVPRRRIFSSARTGFGCLNEYEFVLLSGPTEAQINYSRHIRGY